MAEGAGRRAQQHVADGILAGGGGAAAVHVGFRHFGQTPGDQWGEAHEARPFSDQVEISLDHLAEVDGVSTTNAQPDRILALADLPVEQEAVAMRRGDEPLEKGPVVEHVGVHEHDVLAAPQDVARRPHGNDGAFTEARVKEGADEAVPARRLGLGQDLVLAVADDQRHAADAEVLKNFDVAPQQGRPGEPQQRFRWLRIIVAIKAPANAGGQDDCFHGHSIQPR